MIIVKPTEAFQTEAPPDVSMKTFFSRHNIENANVRFGKVIIPPGTRVPLTGEGAHEEDEYSLIIKGTIRAGFGDEEVRLTAGDASYIPVGEAHWAYNDGDEDCEIVWALVKR